MPRRDTLTHRGRGRPTLYTTARADLIVEAVSKGNHLISAAHLAGIGERTLHTWLEKGYAYQYALENGQPTNPRHAEYAHFRQRLDHARACSEDWGVDVIRRDAEGGQVTSEEPVTDEKGQVQYDEDGRVLWKRTYTSPNGRLALAFMARMSPQRWGEKGRVEVTGADGAPLVPTGPLDASGERDPEVASLIRRMALTAGNRQPGWDHYVPDEGAEPEGGDVQDGVLVEEGDDA